MYDEIPSAGVHRRAVLLGLLDALGFLAILAAVLLGLACLFSGCSAPGDYFGDRPGVALANAKPGLFAGVTAAAPAIVAGQVRSAGWLNGLGAVLLAGGCFALSQHGVRNSLGFGLALSGVSLLVAGFILPLYAGWVGLALLGALLVHFWGRFRAAPPLGRQPVDASPSPGFLGRLKTLLHS
jgi:hypothetical protein